MFRDLPAGNPDLAALAGGHVGNDWNQELAADALDWHGAAVHRFPSCGPRFASPVAVPAGADTMTRVVAFAGRRP